MKVELFLNGVPWHKEEWDCIPRVGDRIRIEDEDGIPFDGTVEDIVWIIDDRAKNRYIEVKINAHETVI
ncbi:hypothetical protein AAC03nite_28240 [Alicyclobacillus acidoterrestris]|nr:hypothetical protein AAC03nite_28240 [Alicyclobacillus acidoterrestris]